MLQEAPKATWDGGREEGAAAVDGNDLVKRACPRAAPGLFCSYAPTCILCNSSSCLYNISQIISVVISVITSAT